MILSTQKNLYSVYGVRDATLVIRKRSKIAPRSYSGGGPWPLPLRCPERRPYMLLKKQYSRLPPPKQYEPDATSVWTMSRWSVLAC